MMKKKYRFFLLCFLLFPFVFLAAQQDNAADPSLLVGMTLSDLIKNYGIPKNVYAVRGVAAWQDDVVFVYDVGDFYIIENRVWQLGLKSAYLIRAGDSRSAAFLNFGEALFIGMDYAVFPLKGKNWPLALRCNFDSAGKVTAIFMYRSDL